MEYRSLGQHGVKVSPLCLGTMMFGGQTDEGVSRRIIDRAFEQGVNFLDTADVYNEGRSEEVVGRTIAANRDKWVLATKFAGGRGHGLNDSGASRKYIVKAVEASLKRLGTDYIDLLYIHREDRTTPAAESVGALGDLIRDGKVRYYGLSNHRAWKIAEFSHVADTLGVPRPTASQPCYNLANRQPEVEHLTACAHYGVSHVADTLGVPRPTASQPCYNLANRQPEVEHLTACAHYGVGVMPYSPLARGVLTAKYDPNRPPPADTRAGRNDTRIHQTEWRAESLGLAQEIERHARKRDITAGQFALAWVLNNQLVTSAIVGPRTLSQWEDYVPALNYHFTADDEALVDRLVATGHPSTPGYNDPSHPYLGRLPRSA